MSDSFVTIPEAEYDRLTESQRILDALYAAGVDNWEWFGDAMDMLEGE